MEDDSRVEPSGHGGASLRPLCDSPMIQV